MAPIATKDDDIEEQLKIVIHNLYCLMVQSYEYHGPTTEKAMTDEIQALISNLQTFSRSSRSLDTTVPPEIIEYIENARNPDIYTREFVELAQRMNQQLKGKSAAFAQFRDALAREIKGAMPDMETEVDSVLMRTSHAA